MNGKAQSISEQLEQLERETSMSLAITDPAKFKANRKKIERLQKQFILACNK